MGRAYAGVLGLLAFATVIGRGLVRSASVDSILGTAIACLALFGVIGGLIGSLAGWIVADSLRSRLKTEANQEMAANSARAAQ